MNIKKLQLFLNKRKVYVILLALLLIGSILRSYNFLGRYTIGDETVRDAFVGIEGAKILQLPLTGPFSSLGPFTFGPWYWYQLIGFTLLTQSPYASWVYLIVISVLYVFIMYKIGVLLENQYFGLLLAALATFSPSQLLAAQLLTNPNVVNIFAALAILLFIKIIKENASNYWGLVLGFVIGVGINVHYQMQGLFILIIAILFLKPKQLKLLLLTLLGLFVSFIPLLFFDLNNHWFTTRNMLHYYLYGKNAIYVPNRWLTYVTDFWPGLWANTFGLTKIYGFILLYAALVILVFRMIKRKLPRLLVTLFWIFIFEFILLRYYWGERFYAYINFLSPFVFIFTGYLFYQIRFLKYGKILGTVAIVIFITAVVPQVAKQLETRQFNTNMYDEFASMDTSIGNKPVVIYFCNQKQQERVYSMAFLEYVKYRKEVSNIKIGISTAQCDKKRNQVLKMSQLSPGIYMSNLTNRSSGDLLKDSWTMVTPHTVFDKSTRWWFAEQP